MFLSWLFLFFCSFKRTLWKHQVHGILVVFRFVFSDLIFELVGLCNQETDLVHVDKNTLFPFLLQLKLNPGSPTGFILRLEFVS
jgi:hypothetical protein